MSRFQTQLAGCHVLVTGGTKGLGRVIVESFLAEGASVSYCARTVHGNEFDHFSDKVGQARAVGTVVDLADLNSIESWVNKSAQEFGRIDIVVANATPNLFEPTIEAWKGAFQAEILGLVTLINVSAPYLKEQPCSAIVVVGSLAGYEARHPHLTGPYPTIKRAQSTLAQGYARDLAPHNVRVNVVVPGSTETPPTLLPDGTQALSTADSFRGRESKSSQQVLQAIPMGRRGAAQDVANAVVFLSSPLAASTTGTTLFVDSGMSMFF